MSININLFFFNHLQKKNTRHVKIGCRKKYIKKNIYKNIETEILLMDLIYSEDMIYFESLR